MSRSRKKNPVYKDRGLTCYNKILRAKNKQRLRISLYKEDTVFVLLDEAVNQWSVCDYTRRLDTWFTGNKSYRAFMK